MAAWPASLPQELVRDGLAVGYQSNVVRYQAELGPPLSRRRGTAAPKTLSGSMVISAAQFATWSTFFEATIKYGADSFSWNHPIDDSAITVKFAAEPELEAIGGGYWRLNLSLLILP